MTTTIRRGDPGAPIRRELARRQERRRASHALDRLLGIDPPGRAWFTGEYAPELARIALADTQTQEQFVTDARRFALRVLLAIEDGASATEVWTVIHKGGTGLVGGAA